MALAAEGARVALLGRSREKLEAVAAEMAAGSALAVAARHDDDAQAAAAVRKVVEAFGRLDVLVNNAGSYVPGTVAELEAGSWSDAVASNLTGPYLLSHEALPHLRKTRGSIVNVSSSLGLQPIAGAAAYCTAKAGLIMLTRALALEEAPHGVRSNAICPGVVDTPIHRKRVGENPQDVESFLARMGEMHPLGRVGRPEEIAELVLFLASEASGWTTGAVIAIDGGISLT
jgi:meso-butanediol dehydrogenase/(S,S)-butanediol dehydrogenase/diacetyl reductase